MTNSHRQKIIVDADACPFKEDILEVARETGARLVLVASANHQMPVDDVAEIVVVDHRTPDAADFEVFNRTVMGDVVITQDSGLAAMVMGKGAVVLSPRGQRYRAQEIGSALERRHLIRRQKRSGGRVRGPAQSPVSESDRQRLRRSLILALEGTGLLPEVEKNPLSKAKNQDSPLD